MPNTIFEDIIAGNIPCHKVFESNGALAFLDINPTALGHTLVIPKKPSKTVFDISEDSLCEVMQAVKEVTNILKKKLGATGVNLLNASGKDAQQTVDYFHIHVIPRFSDDNKDFWPFEVNEDIDLKNVLKALLQ